VAVGPCEKPPGDATIRRLLLFCTANPAPCAERLDLAAMRPTKGFSRQDNTGYLFILPFYLFFAVFIVLPILMNLALSFTRFNLQQMRFIGLQNYLILFEDEFFVQSLVNTGLYTFFTLALTMPISLFLAILLNRRLVGTPVFRTAAFVPHVVSMVAASMIWFWMYEPAYGIINRFLAVLGIPGQLWLHDERLALASIIIMSIWKYTGYYMVIYLAGLQTIPSYLYEATAIDGATEWQKIWYVTIPMLRPVTFFLFVTGVINNFNVFEQVNILTQGGPMNATTTVVHQIYIRAFRDFLMGYAAAQAIFVLIVVAILTMMFFKYGSQEQDVEVA
jgi:ABC-type sugar transport system permease subunit